MSSKVGDILFILIIGILVGLVSWFLGFDPLTSGLSASLGAAIVSIAKREDY